MTDRIRRFWEKIGFRTQGYADFPGVVRTHYWVDPNGTPTDLPDINSLDDLFKWAVPKVIKNHSKIFKVDEAYSRREIFRWWLEKVEAGLPFTQALFEALYLALEVEG